MAEPSAPSTRWSRRRSAGDGPVDLDTAVLRLVGGGAGLALVVVSLPALLVAGLLGWVWRSTGWRRRWLLVVAAATGVLAAVVAGPLTDRVVAAATILRADPSEGSGWWVAVTAVALPSVATGALLAAVFGWWRQLRAPSWRGDDGDATVRPRRERRVVRRLGDTLIEGDQVLLGIDRATGEAAGVPLPMLGRHTLVVGSTGSGKTTSATRLAAATLQRGGGLLVVDLKGDPDTVAQWRRIAARHGRPCRVWSLDADAVYDPLAAGGVSERTRKVMALADWTEPYYRDQAEQLLQLTLRTLDEANEAVSLAGLHRVLTPDGLAHLRGRADGPAAAELTVETASMTPGRVSALESLRTKIGLLTQAEYGPRLDPALAPADRPALDLTASLAAAEVVVVSLDELAYGHIAARLAEVVLTDVAAAAGARLRDGGEHRDAMVWVDEFSAMRPGPLASLFARVRSARIGLLLSTQEVSDLVRDDPTFRAAVATNVATVLTHRVHDPESAEWLARLIGTRTAWQETSQVEAINDWGEASEVGGATGLGTIREVEQYLVHPNRIKSLPDHQVYLARLDQPADGKRARRVAVVPLGTPTETPAPGEPPIDEAPPSVEDVATCDLDTSTSLHAEGYGNTGEHMVDNVEGSHVTVRHHLPGGTW